MRTDTPSPHSPRNKEVIGAGQLATGSAAGGTLRENNLRTEILEEAAGQAESHPASQLCNLG